MTKQQMITQTALFVSQGLTEQARFERRQNVSVLARRFLRHGSGNRNPRALYVRLSTELAIAVRTGNRYNRTPADWR